MGMGRGIYAEKRSGGVRSEEHTSELQSQSNLVCRLLLEKKNAEALVMLGIEQPHAIAIPQLIERVWAMQQPYLITIVVERSRRRRRTASTEPSTTNSPN